jgi:hypothetical protein
MKWFRFYSEFRSDPKMRRMPIAHRYAFVVLLCLSGESENRGTISGLDDDDIAYELEMSTEDWLTLKAKFKVKGLIEFAGDTITIVNWGKRQFESDSSAVRVARHRASKKRCRNNDVTLQERFSNDDVTEPAPTEVVGKADNFKDKAETDRTEPVAPETTAPPIAPSNSTDSSPKGSSEMVIARKNYPKSKRKAKAIAAQYPDDCQKFWNLYSAFCGDVEHSEGQWAVMVAVWDDLVVDTEVLTQVMEGTEYYCTAKRMQFVKTGQALGVSHAFRYLRDRKWEEALNHKRRKEDSGIDLSAMSKGDRENLQRRMTIRRAIAGLVGAGGAGGEDGRTINV